ncbi:hypothetical protein BAU14_02595 [Enterococcus sp. CU9D]|nr:hypothetical protein BAU14_02595 [Enterococcus sp. CU9D]
MATDQQNNKVGTVTNCYNAKAGYLPLKDLEDNRFLFLLISQELTWFYQVKKVLLLFTFEMICKGVFFSFESFSWHSAAYLLAM